MARADDNVLVRKVYVNPFAPAVLLVHRMFYETGKSAEEKHREIGMHYQLPGVSMRPSIYAQGAGMIDRRELTSDDLHPNSEGHARSRGRLAKKF